MFQAMLIKWAISAVIDVVIDAAAEKAKETDNDLDDKFVAQLVNNKELLKATVRGKL